MREPRTVVMSIHPHHAGRIYSGAKTYEFRRRASGLGVGDKILIYESSPVSAVTGEATVESVITGSTSTLSGLEADPEERANLLAYLESAADPVALRLTEVARYAAERRLLDIGVHRPPQSYQFVEDSWGTLPS